MGLDCLVLAYRNDLWVDATKIFIGLYNFILFTIPPLTNIKVVKS